MKKQSAIDRLSLRERGVLEKIAEAILCERESEEWEIDKLILKLCDYFLITKKRQPIFSKE